MNIHSFLDHWGLNDNPFRAEEAKDDPIFQKMKHGGMPHPDFEKIYGTPNRPSPAVVFGEKGSGKTAMRLQIIDRLKEHSKANPEDKIWVISYDELNPVLDRFTHKIDEVYHKDKNKPENPLTLLRLEDHMDGILSLGVTDLVDLLLHEDGDGVISSRKLRKKIRKMPAQKRLDMAELAMLYDQPSTEDEESRWIRVRKLLRFGGIRWLAVSSAMAFVLTAFAITFGAMVFSMGMATQYTWSGFLLCAAGAVLLAIQCIKRKFSASKLAKKIYKDVRMSYRRLPLLRNMIGNMPGKGFSSQPVPVEGDQDSRYQLTQRFMNILKELGYNGTIVLFDRIDEPAVIKGDSDRMRQLVWPMLDNKLLQQPGLGIKMLLPVELRHMLKREDNNFYQRARLDKQQMIDQLRWSGSTLYDICNKRIEACRNPEADPITLQHLFEDNVTATDLIDALDQMHQPRDAFKFVYQIVHEHCIITTEEENAWRIPKATLEHIRRDQAQRVQELYRGLAPA